MSALIPCPGCKRHVKEEETACPFCQAALAPKPCSGLCFGPPAVRLGRAALAAAGVALLGAACQTTTVLPPYGIPPHPDADHSTVDAGGQSDASNGSGGDGARGKSGDAK
jgi:hypothetical protein